MSDGHGDLDNDAYRAGYQDAASAVRKAVLEEAIEALKKRRWARETFDDTWSPRESAAVALAIEGDVEVLQKLMCHERSVQVDQSVSAPPLQSGADREADNRSDCQLVSFIKGSELFLARAQQAIDAAKSSDHKLAVLANYGDMALERLVHGVALLRQFEEPQSGSSNESGD